MEINDELNQKSLIQVCDKMIEIKDYWSATQAAKSISNQVDRDKRLEKIVKGFIKEPKFCAALEVVKIIGREFTVSELWEMISGYETVTYDPFYTSAVEPAELLPEPDRTQALENILKGAIIRGLGPEDDIGKILKALNRKLTKAEMEEILEKERYEGKSGFPSWVARLLPFIDEPYRTEKLIKFLNNILDQKEMRYSTGEAFKFLINKIDLDKLRFLQGEEDKYIGNIVKRIRQVPKSRGLDYMDVMASDLIYCKMLLQSNKLIKINVKLFKSSLVKFLVDRIDLDAPDPEKDVPEEHLDSPIPKCDQTQESGKLVAVIAIFKPDKKRKLEELLVASFKKSLAVSIEEGNISEAEQLAEYLEHKFTTDELQSLVANRLSRAGKDGRECLAAKREIQELIENNFSGKLKDLWSKIFK